MEEATGDGLEVDEDEEEDDLYKDEDEVDEDETSGVKKVNYFDYDDDAEVFIFNASFDNDFRADYYDEF